MHDETDSREEELQIWHYQKLISQVSAACLDDVKEMSPEVSSVKCLSSDGNLGFIFFFFFYGIKPCSGLEISFFRKILFKREPNNKIIN